VTYSNLASVPQTVLILDVELDGPPLVVDQDGGAMLDGTPDVVDIDVVAQDGPRVGVCPLDRGAGEAVKEALGSASRMLWAKP
jgi:hypothetical protein